MRLVELQATLTSAPIVFGCARVPAGDLTLDELVQPPAAPTLTGGLCWKGEDGTEGTSGGFDLRGSGLSVWVEEIMAIFGVLKWDSLCEEGRSLRVLATSDGTWTRAIAVENHSWLTEELILARIHAGAPRLTWEGKLTSLSACVAVYQPEVLAWLIASCGSSGGNIEVPSGLRLLEVYDRYDRYDRHVQVANEGPIHPLDRTARERRFLPAFRDIAVVLQVCDRDVYRARSYYLRSKQLNPYGCERFVERALCVREWLFTCPSSAVFVPRDRPRRAGQRPLLQPVLFHLVELLVGQLSQASIDRVFVTEEVVKAMRRYQGPTADHAERRALLGPFVDEVNDLLVAASGPSVEREDFSWSLAVMDAMGVERALSLLRPAATYGMESHSGGEELIRRSS